MAVSNVELIVNAVKAINPLRQVDKEGRKVQRTMSGTQRAMRNLSVAAGRMGDQMRAAFNRAAEGAKALSNKLSGLGGAILSVGAGALTKRIIGQAAEFKQTEVRLKALSEEYGEFGRIQELVSQNAKTFNQSQAESASKFSDVYARLRPLGISLDQIQTVYEGFNATALASGTSAAAASSAFLQLSQALGSGRLQGDEFRSIAEQVPGILGLVSKEMNVTVGELKQLGSDGKITSDILINALAKGFDLNKDKIDALLAESPAQQFQAFSNAVSGLSNAIGTELLPVVVPVVKQLTELVKAFGDLPGPVKTFTAAIIGLTGAAVTLAPALLTIKTLLGAISIGGLIAAGPWIALGAGVTALGVAVYDAATAQDRFNKRLEEAPISELEKEAEELTEEADRLEEVIKKAQGTISDFVLEGDIERVRRMREQVAQLKEAAFIRDYDATQGADLNMDLITRMSTEQDQAEKAAQAAEQKKQAEAARKLAESQAKREEARRQSQARSAADLAISLQRQIDLTNEVDDAKDRILQRDHQIADLSRQFPLLKQAEIEQLEILIEKLYQAQEAEIARDQAARDAAEAAEQAAKDAEDAERARQKALEADPGYQMQQELEELLKLENQVAAGATAIGNAFANSFKGLVTGAKTGQEALADMMSSVAEHFMDMATQIIAKQLAIIVYGTIMKALGVGLPGGGGGGGGGAPTPPVTMPDAVTQGGGGLNIQDIGDVGLNPTTAASGGYFSTPTRAFISEGGEPEYVIPESKMRSAMSRYSRGARGGSVIPESGDTGTSGEGGVATAAPIDVRYTVERINSVDYVTADQFQAGMQQAAAQGARQGEQQTLKRLQMSGSTRKRIGL